MKSIGTLEFATVGANKTFERGKVEIPKGRGLAGIFLKMTVALTNGTAGDVTLTAAQKQSFLSGWRISLKYGPGLKRKPYNSILFTRLQRISRFLVGADWEGYTDTSTGLGQTISAAATDTCVLYAFVPTGYIWHDKKIRRLFVAGRSQAKTMQLEIKREADTLPTNVTVSGSVTIDIIPRDVSAPADRWLPLLEWHETDETDKIAKLPEGLCLYAAEDSAVLASTSITDAEVRIDGEVQWTQMGAVQAYKPYLQEHGIDADADVSDYETPLHQYWPDRDFSEMPTGTFTFEQITKDLTTASIGGLIAPILSDEEVRAIVAEVASKAGRNKPIKAVNAAVVEDGFEGLKSTHYPYVPFYLYDPDDAEFQSKPGLVSSEGELGQPYVPESVLERARGAVQEHMVKGEVKAAQAVYKRVALAIPGAVQDPRGFSKKGSPIFDQVRATIDA